MLGNPLLLSDDGYNISRSVRLRSSASAYFNRTPAGAGNRKTWTWSGWVKRGTLGATQWLFDADNGSTDSTEFNFAIGSGDTLIVAGSLTTWRVTTQVFRDPSAWYHIVLAVDTSQATANNRIRLYVNGSEVTAFSTLNNPTLNLDLAVNQAIAHYIGIRTGLTSPLDGYLTEVNFIDGQALTPSSFGETDTITGVWKPKKYAGTYGTNGFYLKFNDGSNLTNLCLDRSGNGNNWTATNVSLTAGATYDWMVDTPTCNYAVLNPLDRVGSPAVSDGNLTAYTGTTSANVRGTIPVSSGKWYWEVTAGTYTTSPTHMVGVCDASVAVASSAWGSANAWTYYASNGNKYNNGANSAYGATWTTGDVIGIALDMDAGTLEFYKNGVSQGVAYTGLTGKTLTSCFGSAFYTLYCHHNFGQRPFAYTPPTGFVALNTQNLPDSTIKKGNQYFDVAIQTRTGVASSVTGVGFQPDLVWDKARGFSYYHTIYDSVRGVQKELQSNTTAAETTQASGVTAFNSDGFSYGTRLGGSTTYVSWLWKESATAGFDIVTFTNPSSGSSSFAHNLGVKPSMIIVKSRSNTSNWTTAHKSLGAMASTWINLESTAAAQTSSNIWGGEPTSSVFYCGTGIQVAGATMVAYLFAEVAGFSRFGSVTMNGSADGAFVFTGFLPKLVMLKRTDSTSNWIMWDTVRNTYNVVGAELYPNLSNTESTVTDLDILSNGFKMRNSGFSGTWIYAAWADSPFKNSLAR